jgi:hypothetical protein
LIIVEVASTDTAENLGGSFSKIRQRSIDLLDHNGVIGCWALMYQLFRRRFFYYLGLTPLYSGGKGKPRYAAKRPHGREHAHLLLAFDTDQLNLEDRETICKLEEENQRQDALCKEAAIKAAAEVEQTSLSVQISKHPETASGD